MDTTTMGGYSSGEKKFRELIIYISHKSETDENFGATKLNKLLFFSDFLAYCSLGQSISGQEYQKLPHGPAPRRLVPVREEMARRGDLALRKSDFFGFPQNKTFALRKADLSDFSGDEIALIDHVIEELKDSHGRDVSDLSHRFAGWELAQLNETIPYQTALVGQRKLNRLEVEYGATLEAQAKSLLTPG